MDLDGEREISSRGRTFLTPATPYFQAHIQALNDHWSPQRETGMVTLAVAENKLTFDLLQARLPSLSTQPIDVAGYTNMRGMDRFREALASFMSQHICRAGPINHNDLCVSTGVGSLLNHMALALFEHGDGVLVPAPSYASFDFDLKVVAGVKTLPVQLDPPDYPLTYEALERARASYEAEGVSVRGLIVTSPHNPLGVLLSENELKNALTLCRRHNMHLISDEVYAASVFEEAPPLSSDEDEGSSRREFKSIAKVVESEGRSLGSYVHVLYGFSKDFNVSGFRVGVLYSQNKQLMSALDSVSYFCAVPNPMQHALCEVITDNVFVRSFFEENARRLKAACNLCRATLDRLRVSYVRPAAGMFVWVDLSELLDADTWDAEQRLVRMMVEDHQLILTPGASNHASSPGFFRLCFAFHSSLEVLAEGLRRLEEIVVNSRLRRAAIA